MPADEYESWQETMYLLSSPKNAERLRESLAEANAGRAEPHDLTASSTGSMRND